MCPRGTAPRRRSTCWLERGYSAGARSTSREGSGWTTTGPVRFGDLAREERASSCRSSAQIAGFMGHAERGKKLNMATGMLDHSAGIAKAAGAEVVVFHPGVSAEQDARGGPRLRGGAARASCARAWRARTAASRSGSRSWVACASWGSDRRRARDLPPRRLGAARDRFRAHARDERRRLHRLGDVRGSAQARGRGARARARPSTSTSRTSPSRTGTRRSISPYGEGTLRAEPLTGRHSAPFERPATVISESPDEASSQTIKAILSATRRA